MSSNALHFVRDYLLTIPDLAKFALGMVMIVSIPRLCRRTGIPAVVGLLLGGTLVGPYTRALKV